MIVTIMADNALEIFQAKRLGLAPGETISEMVGAFAAQHVIRRYGGQAGLEFMGIPAEFAISGAAGLLGVLVGGDTGKALGRFARGSAVSWAAVAGAATGIASNIAREG